MNVTHSRGRAHSGTRGYTLVELMMVVAITGVLAAVAIPAFNSYIQRGRVQESTNFLGVIKLRQEAYFAEFGAYACEQDVPGSITFVPGNATVMKGAITAAWPSDTWFTAISARPDGQVRFGYGMACGTPAQALTNLATSHGVTAATANHYFVAQAVTDLDADNIPLVCELTSFTTNIWVGSNDGEGGSNTRLASGKGWE